ncbi:MAG: serine hydrolase [Roseiflexaceae bacterium]|nr:serine hydrolase [Roseiflexaceae bacterium]
MTRSQYRATPLVALAFVLAACATQAAPAATVLPAVLPTSAPSAVPSVVPEPTATPESTALPKLARNISIAGVDVGGLDLAAARAELMAAIELEPLTLITGPISTTIAPQEIGLAPALDELLADARTAKAGDELALKLTFDQAQLRAVLIDISAEIAGEAGGLDVIRDTELVSASFVLRAPETLDVDQAAAQVAKHLNSTRYAEPLAVLLTLGEAGDTRPIAQDMQRELAALAGQLKGVLGVYIYDLKSGKKLASLNENTAFSTASTIKTAIMLNAYAHVEKFSAKQTKAMRAMIIESDNLKANDVLAASVGGIATEQAFEGAQLMSDMLAELGLPTTYQYTPFEANDFIKLYKTKYTLGPKQAGQPPYTASSRVQRTTPAEMAQLYVMIEQCSRGEGALVEAFPDTLDDQRCQEMLDLLRQNEDVKRMVSGLPASADVAHKSGWAQPDLQGDAGIVRTNGGDFIISVYFYQDGERYSDRFVQRLLGNVTRLAYSFYNPELIAAE